MSTVFVKETSPHIHRKASVERMMLDVLIALIPVVVFSIIAFTTKALMILGISLFTMIGSELVFVGIKNAMPFDGQKHTFKEKFQFAYKKLTWSNILAPAISAVIYAMILPASVSWYTTLIGALFGIIIGKLVFGGLGYNIFNPAAVGMVIAKLSFANDFKVAAHPFFDTTAGATILSDISNADIGYAAIANENVSVLNLLIGNHGGTLGEICALCIIVGGIYLFVRRSADLRCTLSYFLTFTFMMAVAGACIVPQIPNLDYFKFLAVEVLSGGMLFAAVFMITDPVTSPIDRPSRIMFGMVAGVANVFIRLFGALPEGAVFSILIANMIAPVLDYYKWAGNQYTKKKILAMGLILVIPLIIMIIVLCFGGVVK